MTNVPPPEFGWLAIRCTGPWHRALKRPLIGRFALSSTRDTIRVYGTNSLCFGDGAWRYWRAPDDLPQGARLCTKCEGKAARLAGEKA